MPSLFNERHVNNHVIYVEAVQFFRSCDDSLFVFFKVLVDAFFAWIFSKTTNKFTKPKKKKTKHQVILQTPKNPQIHATVLGCLAAWRVSFSGSYAWQHEVHWTLVPPTALVRQGHRKRDLHLGFGKFRWNWRSETTFWRKKRQNLNSEERWPHQNWDVNH